MTDRTRAAGVLGALAGAAAIVLAPLVTAASIAAAQVERGQEPGLNRMLAGWLQFDTPQAVYVAYAKLWLLVLAGFLVAAVALRERVGASLGTRGAWGAHALMVGLATALVGNVGDFWLSLSPTPASVVHSLLSVGGLLVAIGGAVLLGFEARKAKAMPESANMMLLLTPLGIPRLALVSNWPAAPMLWMGAAWLAVGLWLAAPRPAEEQAPEAPPAGGPPA